MDSTILNPDTPTEADKDKISEPTHNMSGKYVALMETNGKECESWYYFIRYEGNEEMLKYLHNQLEKVDWYVLDDLSVFDLDLQHFVSAQTAKEMTKLELNSYAFHRKFDGKLKQIDFKFKSKDLKNNEKMIGKVFDLLGYGQIEDFINDEDIDSEDLTDNTDTDTDSSDTSSNTENDSDDTKKDKKNKKGVPPILSKNVKDLPGWKKKQRKKH